MINSFSLRLIPLRPVVNASGFYVWRQELSMIFESLEYFKENLRKHAKKRRNISFIYLVEEIRSFFKYYFFFLLFFLLLLLLFFSEKRSWKWEHLGEHVLSIYVWFLAASWNVILSTCLRCSLIGYREANKLFAVGHNAKRLISRKNIISVEVHC